MGLKENFKSKIGVYLILVFGVVPVSSASSITKLGISLGCWKSCMLQTAYSGPGECCAYSSE